MVEHLDFIHPLLDWLTVNLITKKKKIPTFLIFIIFAGNRKQIGAIQSQVWELV